MSGPKGGHVPEMPPPPPPLDPPMFIPTYGSLEKKVEFPVCLL